MGIGPFSSESTSSRKSYEISGPVTAAEGGTALAFLTTGSGVAVGPGATYLRTGKGGDLNYTVQATNTNTGGASSFLADAIGAQASRGFAGEADRDLGGGIGQKQWLIGGALLVVGLLVFLFLRKR